MPNALPNIKNTTILFDRYIHCTFYEGTKVAAIIKTPKAGIKPKIVFQWKRVPGQFAYSCRLEITNWFSNIAWYKYTRVVIEAGYQTQASMAKEFAQIIDCQIFASHKPNGGPDMPVIFECIVAKAESNLLNDSPYTLHYYNKESIGAVITEVCNKLKLTPSLYIDPYLEGEIFSVVDIEESFKTGYQVLNYVYKALSSKVAAKGDSLQMLVFNNHLIIQQRDTEGNVYPDKQLANAQSLDAISVPILDKTTDVTFTAGTLSATAPWHPDIYPGAIFYCLPSYFTGGVGYPNSVAQERALSQKSKDNVYYVLSQTVRFSTVDNINEMTINAVPLSNSPAKALLSEEEVQKQAEEAAKKTQKVLDDAIETIAQVYKDAHSESTITIGAKDSQEVPAKSAWESSWMPDSYEAYQIKAGDTLSGLLDKKRAGGSLKPPFDVFSDDVVGKTSTDPNFRVSGVYFGYPLIALATYHYYIQLRSKNPGEAAKYRINASDPDNIKTGNYLIIPQLKYESLNKNEDVARLFAEITEYYNAKGRKSWSKPSQRLAQIITEGGIGK